MAVATLHPRIDLATEGSMERRVVEAADECVCRWGWSKTTLADIAAEAGVARASLYRAFPGGRDAIFDALRRHRERRFFLELHGPLSSRDTLVETVVDTMVTAAESLRDDVDFQAQLRDDPGPLLQQLTFAGLDRILAASRVFVAPYLTRFVPRREAVRIAEWATRVVVSYAVEPSSFLDLTNPESVQALVSTQCHDHPAPRQETTTS